MEKPNWKEYRNMTTGEISLRLRTWAETIRNKRQDRYKLLIHAADRLDELDERVAIMTEPSNPTEEQLSFPPDDKELGGGSD